MDSFVEAAGSWVLSWSAVPFLEKPHDYAKYIVNPPSYWFVSPGVSALDLIITSLFTILLSGALIACSRSALWQVSIAAASDDYSSTSPTSTSSVVALASRRSVRNVILAAADYILRFLCVVCAGLTVYNKGASGRFIYLLQPCHLSNFTLVALLLLPRRSTLASRLFYFNNHCAFGTAMALLTPDLKALIMPGEVAYFFLQHWTLVMLPLVWMLRRRYPLYRATLRLTTLMWSLFSVLHWTVLFPFSIACNANINYMLMPPKVWPSSLPGYLYRPAILFACCPITYLFRAIIQALVWLGGTYGDAAAEAAAAAAGKTEELPAVAAETRSDKSATAESGLRRRREAPTAGAEAVSGTVQIPDSPVQAPVSSRTRAKDSGSGSGPK